MSASSENIQKSEIFKEKGNECFRAKDYQSALKNYNTALNLNPDNAVLYFNRAMVYIRELHYEKAIEDCTKALSLNSEYIKAYEKRAQAYFGLKDYPKAIKDLISLLELDPSLFESRCLLEKCYELVINEKKSQRPKGLLAHIKQPDTPEIIEDDYLLYDSPEYIEKTVHSCIKLHEKIKDLRKSGKYSAAVQETLAGLNVLNQVIAKKNEKIDKVKMNFIVKLSKCYLGLVEFDKALEVVNQGLKIYFNNENFLNYFRERKIHVLQIKGDYEQALKEILMIKKVQSNEKLKIEKEIAKLKFLVYPNTGNLVKIDRKRLESALKKWMSEKENAIKLFKNSKFDEAICEFENIIWEVLNKYDSVSVLAEKELKDFVITLYNNIAIGFARQGLFHKSIKICFKVLLIEFNNPKALFRLGKNCFELGEFFSAKNCFEILIDIEPENKLHHQEMKNIEAELEKINFKEEEKLENSKKVDFNEENRVDLNENQEKIEEIKGKTEENRVIIEEIKAKTEENQLNNEENHIKAEEKEVNHKVINKNPEYNQLKATIITHGPEKSIENNNLSLTNPEDLKTYNMKNLESPKNPSDSIQIPPEPEKQSLNQEAQIKIKEIPLPSPNPPKPDPKALETDPIKNPTKKKMSPNINSIISSISPSLTFNKVPKSHSELVSTSASIQKSSQPLAPYLKLIPETEYKNLIEKKDFPVEILEFYVKELSSYSNKQESWVGSILLALSKIDRLKISLMSFNRESKINLENLLEEINDSALKQRFY